MGKHRKPSLFRRLFPKRTTWLDSVNNLPRLHKSDYAAERVLVMPKRTFDYILSDYCPN